MLDADDILEKIDAGKITAVEFGEILCKVAAEGQHQEAIDLYERLPVEERYGGASPSRGVGLMNDHGITTLIHCYNRTGKPSAFQHLCSSIADKRKYTHYIVEQMVECFSDLDRLDILEALLIGWLVSPSALIKSKKSHALTSLEWNEVISTSLGNDKTSVECDDDLKAFMDSLLSRANQKPESRLKRSFISSVSSRPSSIACELLAQLDTGTLGGVFPGIDVWKRIVTMYANRGAWQHCMHIASFCMHIFSSHEEKNVRALHSITHHTVRVLCRGGRFTQALDFLDVAEKQLGEETKKAATIALFLPYFHRNGTITALQYLVNEVLSIVTVYQAGGGEDVSPNEVRSLLASCISLLCKRGYVNEALLLIDEIAAVLGKEGTIAPGIRRDILRPSTLSMLVNACAMRGDDRAAPLFRALQFREGALARIMCNDGFDDAVNRAYHAMHASQSVRWELQTLPGDGSPLSEVPP